MPAHDRPPPTRIVPAPTPALCLDFADTRHWRGTPQPTETIADYGALLRWLAGAGVVDPATASALQALPATDGAAAARLLDDAIDMRERWYVLLRALADGAPPADAGRRLAGLLAGVPPRGEPVFAAQACGWRVPMRSPVAAEVLAPVAWSGADLVLGAARTRLRCCANERCGWLFLDESKAGTRRWCSMSACGNRAKARRHAQRAKARAVGA